MPTGCEMWRNKCSCSLIPHWNYLPMIVPLLEFGVLYLSILVGCAMVLLIRS